MHVDQSYNETYISIDMSILPYMSVFCEKALYHQWLNVPFVIHPSDVFGYSFRVS